MRHRAGVWGSCYLAVREFVIVEVGRGGETLVADVTRVWLLARVDATVGVERRRCRESLAAHVTFVWLFSCNNIPLGDFDLPHRDDLTGVSADVSGEQRRAVEGFGAHVAVPHASLLLLPHRYSVGQRLQCCSQARR